MAQRGVRVLPGETWAGRTGETSRVEVSDEEERGYLRSPPRSPQLSPDEPS